MVWEVDEQRTPAGDEEEGEAASVQNDIDGALTAESLQEREQCLHALRRHAKAGRLTEANLEELAALLLAKDDLFFHFTQVLLSCPGTALTVLDKLRQEPALSKRGVVMGRIYGIIAAIGVAQDKLWKESLRQLLCSLQNTRAAAHAQCFHELRFLHGVQDQDPGFPYTAAAKFRPPTHTPDEDTVRVVRQVYMDGVLTPEECGGYIDFLEACAIAVNPDDEAVKDPTINTWPGQYSELPSDVLEEMGLHDTFEESQAMREQLHEERLEALREHWVQLNQKKRAKTLSRALSRAIVIFLLYLAIMWVYGYFASEHDGHHHHHHHHTRFT